MSTEEPRFVEKTIKMWITEVGLSSHKSHFKFESVNRKRVKEEKTERFPNLLTPVVINSK